MWPAEWAPHLESILIWPGREEVWGPHLEEARQEIAHMARVISADEPVRLIAPGRLFHSLPEGLASRGVMIEQIDTDDAWARDTGPFFISGTGGEHGVVFRFNSWGGKFTPYAQDAAFAGRLLDVMGLEARHAPLVLEGGAVEVDGVGTAIVVEASVLNENRNPGRTRGDVEAVLAAYLDISHVIWLPFGLADDSDTDGHVDNVARFVSPGRVVCQMLGRDHEDTERLLTIRKILELSRDAEGRQLDIIDIPWLPYSPHGSHRPASYCNFYITNHAVVVPIVGAPSDDDAIGLLASVTSRAPLAVQARALAYGGGGPHCVVMPRYSTTTEGLQ